jgi:hypothetical protein
MSTQLGLFSVSPLNTLSPMLEATEVLPPKRRVELRDAPSQVEVPILFILARAAVIVLIAVLVIGRLIVAFGVEEFKALWPRGRVSPLVEPRAPGLPMRNVASTGRRFPARAVRP